MGKEKKITAAAIITMGILFLGAFVARGGQPQPMEKKLLPDLVVRLKLVAKKTSGSGKTACYSVMPEYTVTNQGQVAARNFQVRIYRKGQGATQGKAFKYWGSTGNLTLAPNQRWTYKGSAVDENVWCSDKKGKVGFKVTVVYSGKEKTKQNNTAVKLFPKFHIQPAP